MKNKIKGDSMKTLFSIGAGALLTASLSIAEPAKAMVITVDDYSTTQSLSQLDVGTITESVGPDASILGGAARDATVNVTNAGVGSSSAAFTTPSIISNAAGFSLPSGYEGNLLLTYNFTSAQDLTSGGQNSLFSFGVIDSDATDSQPITFGISLNGGPAVTQVLTSGVSSSDPALPINFAFSSFSPTALTAANSFQLSVLSSEARDVTFTPVRAIPVPVPPALLGTLFAGGLAVAKSIKKKSNVTENSKS
jgi:hypothetical protein